MRFIIKAASIAAAFVTSAAVAGAQVTVTGTTSGCFGVACTNFSNAANYAIGTSGTSLGFTGASFSGTTNPVTNGFTVGDFGTLVLNGLTSTTANTPFLTAFRLLFTLSAPAGSTAPTSTMLVAGFVGNSNGQGARDISYTMGTPARFTFSNGSGTIMIDGGQVGVTPTAISGRVTAVASTVPEPSTYAMMGMGLAGLLAAARRRRGLSA